MLSFRQRLLDTLRAVEPVLSEPGVLVVGSEVPNLLEPGAASTLVVSQDVDLAIPVLRHSAVKARLGELRGLKPSVDEPSVWTPEDRSLIEVNFIGMDPELRDPTEARVLEDPDLPLLVFGALSLITPGEPIQIDGLLIPVPRPAGLALEKLVTDRTGEKGNRDLLVALGLFSIMAEPDLDELIRQYAALRAEQRHAVRSNLTILSLMERLEGMPDPTPQRARVAALLQRLETSDEASL